VFFFPVKHAPRAPALPSLARISLAIPRASAAIRGLVSSGLTAAVGAIATTVAATIAVVVKIAAAAGPIIAVVAVPAAVLGSNAAAQAARIVIRVATPDLRDVLS